MKKNLFFLLALALGAMVSFTSCGTDDPCKDVECGANGTCFEGECVCNQGYEGTACDVEWATKFVSSTYTAESSCNTGATYQGSVEKLTGTTIRIKEYGGFSGTNHIDATVSKETEASATAQKVTVDVANDGFNRKITGTGLLAGKVLTLNLTIDYNDGSAPETCTDVLTLN